MNNSLISLCLINTLWHKYNKTYVDNFVPLMASTLVNHNHTKISFEDLNEIIANFNNDFGLNLPFHPACAIINKCKKYGILRRYSNTFFLNIETARKYDLTKEIELNIRKQEQLLSHFSSYLEANFDEKVETNIAADIVLSFIKSNDVNIFLSAHDTDSQILPEPRITQKTKKFRYIINKYVSDLYLNRPDLFRIIVEMSLGSIASNAILFTFSVKTSESIKDCIFYIDCPIILKLLGADGSYSIDCTRNLLSSLRENGGKLAIFKHTYEEIREVLESSSEWVESIDFDPARANRTTLYFRQEGYRKSDIELIIASINRVLTEQSITVSPIPDYVGTKVYINETELQNIIEHQITKRQPTFDKEQFRKRTLRDVSSISAVSRLREDRLCETIRDAKYFFMTSNSALSYSNYLYNQKYRSNHGNLLECVSDIFIGTYVWIGTPQTAQEIGALKIIATSLSAIRPDPEMEQAFYLEAKKMLQLKQITQEDYILLTTSFVVSDMLSDKYYGDEGQVTQSSIYEILDEVKNKLLGEKDAEIEKVNRNYREAKEGAEKDAESKLQYYNTLIHIANKKAKSKTMLLMSFIYIFIISLIVIPILPSIFFHWIFIVLSIVFTLLSGYLSYFKGFSNQNIKDGLYEKFIKEEKAKLGLPPE